MTEKKSIAGIFCPMNNNEEIILHGTGYQILKDIVIKINQITYSAISI